MTNQRKITWEDIEGGVGAQTTMIVADDIVDIDHSRFDITKLDAQFKPTGRIASNGHVLETWKCTINGIGTVEGFSVYEEDQR